MERKVTQSSIHWQAAHAACEAAVRKAEAIGVRVNVAVVDRGGHLAAFLRMPGAPFHSIDIARDKAYTSVSFGLPSRQLGEMLGQFSPMVQASLPVRPGVAAFGGGFPIEVDGELVGAIGVSGASEEEDEACAQAGLEAIAKGG